jgi:hypothetical protein
MVLLLPEQSTLQNAGKIQISLFYQELLAYTLEECQRLPMHNVNRDLPAIVHDNQTRYDRLATRAASTILHITSPRSSNNRMTI